MAVINQSIERQRKIRREGFESEKILNQQPRRQWWRADGMPLPKLLPVDSYHFEIYTRKGWTLREPLNPVLAEAHVDLVPATVEQIAEGQGGGTDELKVTSFTVPLGFKLVPVEESSPVDFIAVEPPDVQQVIVPTHRHRMNADEDQCHIQGCEYKRKVPFEAREEKE